MNFSIFAGRLYLYLSQREFISCDGHVDDIKGVAYVPDSQDVLKGAADLLVGSFCKRKVSRVSSNLFALDDTTRLIYKMCNAHSFYRLEGWAVVAAQW